jgi:DNA-binding response OmpR family regulator
MVKPRLLVVDDEETICQVFERTLGKKNYDVLTTQDPERALSELEENFFNLLIVDLKMPGIDGIQLLKKIKEINPYIEVIVITGFGTLQTAVSAIKLGAFDYITKPFNISEIEKIIERCLERQKRAIQHIELKELVAFFEVSKTITSTRNLDELLEKILDSAVQVTNAKRGSLMLIDEERNELNVKSFGSINGTNKEIRFPLNREISNWIALREKPSLINNIKDDTWFGNVIEFENYLKPFINPPLASTPLVFQGKILGIVNVCQKLDEGVFTKRDLTLLTVLASQAAIAIQNARLYKQLQNKIDELENTLNRLNQAQAQLIHSEKLASVGRLAAGIVHEICNPLNVISGQTCPDVVNGR